MEETGKVELLDDIDERSIGRDLGPAKSLRSEVNSTSTGMPLRRHKVNTRSVTSRRSKALTALDNENMPLTGGEIVEAAMLTSTSAVKLGSHFESKKSVETDGENALGISDRDICMSDLGNGSEEEFDGNTCESWRGKYQDRSCRKRVDKNGKKRKSTSLTRSTEERVKKKRQNKPRRKFPCKICGKPYTKFYMDAHMQLHSGEKPFCCQESECKRQFATEYYLRMHIQRCHGKPQHYPCIACDKKLASKRGLVEHMRIHSEARPFICQVCGKGFRQPALLFNHIKTHDDLLPFQCEQCGIRYKYKRSMERHKEKIHDGVLHSFPCKLCERVFSTKSKLKEHQYFHEGNSPHICEICGKRLLARKTLQNHMLIHQGEKPYKCEVCGKLFRFIIVLKRHLSVHTGVKPFRCNMCDRQFIHRVYMDRHKCAMGASARKAETVHVASTLAGEFTTEPLEPLIQVVGLERVNVGQVHGEPLNIFVSHCDERV